MDQTPLISFSRNYGMPDDTEMEQVQSDLKALKGLYGLFQKGPADENQLDEASRAYLMRMLDDATQNALLKQAKMISGSLMPPALERNLSIRSDRQARAGPEPREAVNPPASLSLSLRQVSERLHRLNLQHSPPSSRDGRPVHGNRLAAEEPAALSRLPSNRSSRTAIMPPPHRPSRELPDPAAPSPLLNLRRSTLSSRHVHGHGHAAEEPAVLSRLPSNRSLATRAPQHQSSRVQGNPAAPRPRLDDPHQSASSSRHVLSHRPAAEKPVLSRLVSIHSSRNAMPPPQYHPSREQTDYSGFNLYRLPVAATSQHGTMTGRSPLAQDRTRPIYDYQSSLERDSMRRSVSRKLSLGRERPLDHATAHRVAAEGSSSTRRFRRLGSGVSVGMASRRGSARAGRGVAVPTPRRYSSSSSSNESATIRSRITPHRREITEQFPRRAADEGKLSTPRRQRREEDAAISSVDSRPQRMLNRTNSSSTYTISSPGAARSFTNTGSTASSASASSYSSLPVTRRRGSALPVYPSESSSSDSSRSRRRRRIRDQERKERREGRLRKLKEKIAMVFHHRHDHHHHHHLHQRGQVSTSTDTARSDRHASRNRKSAWKQLGGLFHRTKGRKEKKPASLTVVSVAPKDKAAASQTAVAVVPKKKKSGGGMSVLFGGMRHLHCKHKEAASVKKMSKMVSKMKEPASVKKMSKMATKVKEPASVKKMRKLASKAPGKNKKINWWKLLRKRRGKPQRRLSL